MSNEIQKYYDDLIEYQLKIAFNERHLYVYDRLVEEGLKSNSTVLEIGCGIGVITSMIAGTVKKGSITAIDISEKSIAEANKRIRNKKKLTLLCCDVLKEKIKGTFDFITLFDVIEHIPLEKHALLFSKLKLLLKPNGKVLINIPHPHSVEYDRKNAPHNLQIIDEAVHSAILINNAEKAGFRLYRFTTYSLWKEDDYQFIVLDQKNGFSNAKVVKSKSSKAIVLIRKKTYKKNYL